MRWLAEDQERSRGCKRLRLLRERKKGKGGFRSSFGNEQESLQRGKGERDEGASLPGKDVGVNDSADHIDDTTTFTILLRYPFIRLAMLRAWN